MELIKQNQRLLILALLLLLDPMDLLDHLNQLLLLVVLLKDRQNKTHQRDHLLNR